MNAFVLTLVHPSLQLMLVSVLNCLYDSVNAILRKQVEKKMLLDNLDIVMLAVDEICDNGYANRAMKHCKCLFAA